MRAVIQRSKEASVSVAEEIISQINAGLVILLGVESSDNQEDIEWLVNKIVRLRIMEDEDGKMNNSIMDHEGQILIISQFTLLASCKKGNRPSFIRAAHPTQAEQMYDQVVEKFRSILGDNRVGTGVFGANMQVRLINDGPVTIILDTKNKE